jgi:hypothetical protein
VPRLTPAAAATSRMVAGKLRVDFIPGAPACRLRNRPWTPRKYGKLQRAGKAFPD